MKNSPRQSIPVASILSRCGVACLIWLALSTSAAWAVDTELHNEPITPIQQTVELDPLKVSLGQQLFHEPRLSGDNTISCASCHPISSGGMDGLPRSVGVKGRLGTINTPTIFNSGLAFVQFWDGRAATLEAQIDGPLHNPLEMDGNWDDTLSKLRKDPTYPGKFAAIYSDGITADNIKDAIAAYERSLITPNSPFDRYLRGEKGTLTDQQLRGYRLFKSYGCSSCHQGRLVGANLYEKMGIANDYFGNKQALTTADMGRFNVTGIEEHRHEFKVPSLRNIARTAPYFHDASVGDLHEAVYTMGYYQLGRKIPAGDIEAIVQFLHSLTGELLEQSR